MENVFGLKFMKYLSSKTSKGRAIQNLINIPSDDKIMAYINVDNLKDEEYINSNYILMCTKRVLLKKTSLESYSRPRQNGIKAINIRGRSVT